MATSSWSLKRSSRLYVMDVLRQYNSLFFIKELRRVWLLSDNYADDTQLRNLYKKLAQVSCIKFWNKSVQVVVQETFTTNTADHSFRPLSLDHVHANLLHRSKLCSTRYKKPAQKESAQETTLHMHVSRLRITSNRNIDKYNKYRHVYTNHYVQIPLDLSGWRHGLWFQRFKTFLALTYQRLIADLLKTCSNLAGGFEQDRNNWIWTLLFSGTVPYGLHKYSSDMHLNVETQLGQAESGSHQPQSSGLDPTQRHYAIRPFFTCVAKQPCCKNVN